MDEDRLRHIGLIGGGGALLVALALVACEPQQPASTEPAAEASDVVSAQPSSSASAPIPEVETAMADERPVSIPKNPPKTVSTYKPAQNPNLEFIVRFDDRHPMARAQGLYLQGKRDEAEAAAREILPSRPELAGLCFERFTFGAELVFAHCARVSRAQVQRTSDRWVRKLRATRGVQFVDPNVIADVESK
jgi:hypothetical protein